MDLIEQEQAKKGRLLASRLQKTYGSRCVVRDFSLELSCGQVVGLLGPNGAGKTTSFYMLVGLIGPDRGYIELAGQRIEKLPIHRRARLGLSYLPQEPSIFRQLTVEENIRAVLELQAPLQNPDWDRVERKKWMDQQLTMLAQDLQITHLAGNSAISLSGGERRRVEIARALATQPKFILLDEPFAGVDPIAVLDIQRLVGFLKQKGIGVLITDHNVRETLGICDHAYIINQGQVLTHGTPEHIVHDPDVRRIYLGEHFRM
jgi:lipopolysaccharide export system ATP-binding protein